MTSSSSREGGGGRIRALSPHPLAPPKSDGSGEITQHSDSVAHTTANGWEYAKSKQNKMDYKTKGAPSSNGLAPSSMQPLAGTDQGTQRPNRPQGDRACGWTKSSPPPPSRKRPAGCKDHTGEDVLRRLLAQAVAKSRRVFAPLFAKS
ncbi:hypothetical protein TraAM80_06327 [Trypanosoma rangeli]|uniref:Uncharacterized protein n=1 Tax=Trypanosoma rangeli TaxID=5698 RepID=A0A422NAR0_TRYRA|nr:uncharacterized protein TraAM80_06327 [Trypanosoma rangeli]RNF02543.1 hypothetical protein TraAM80_06327 [Trypanosoma rangeli]|eukprot:RNF02543.1 hypothetical protein TraAM80_06327 [Trypanosoma rangeli]